MLNGYVARAYQQDAKHAIFDYFRKGMTGNPVVAMPTGTGKSFVIADFIRDVLFAWPQQRLMMITHVKELIEQNAEKLIELWPHAPLGIYSAGLNSRDMILPIVFGGVQSISKAIARELKSHASINGLFNPNIHFGWRDIILIDECHLLSPDEESMYQYIIAELKKINPYLKVIGFTATPYRMKQGMITDGGLLTDICFDITDYQSFNRLIAEGFMSPLISKRTLVELDTSEVKITAGEFSQKQLQASVDKAEITRKACLEIIEYGRDRQSWMVFSAGIEHAEHIAQFMQQFGIAAACVHSKLTSKENDERLLDYKNGTLRCIVGNNKLTTGFDHPPIDLIADLQPTMSPGKHVQKGGRGTRISPATQKRNCLMLDFARNVRRLGPINDPVKPTKPGKGGGDAPIRICENCGCYNHASARKCEICGAEFSFETKFFSSAGFEEVLRQDDEIIEYFEVQKVIYNLHEKKSSPPSMKVSYFCGLRRFDEWVCFEHNGWPGKRAKTWWQQRHSEPAPPTTYEALRKSSQLRPPARIRVSVNKQYPEILGAEW